MSETAVQSAAMALWMPVFLVWALSGAASKRTIEVKSPGMAGLANWVVGAAWWLLLSRGFRQPFFARRFIPPSNAAVYGGLALTAVGLLFSLWARFYLGRNWSPVIAVMENHQLMRRGPYAIVRHPIYSGFMLATLGTALAVGEISGLIAVFLIVSAWGLKARLEETSMIEQFGPEYESYRREVKALIPLIW
jgi:protein-S-isoprenylcysteine O-methyltransferase Ste14